MNDDLLGRKLWILLWAGGLGALSYIARFLTGEGKFALPKFIGGLLGSVMSCFVVGSILIEWFEISPLMTLATGAAVGYLGGSLLGSLAVFILKRFGIDPDQGGEKKDVT
jgi:cation transporter-like permease